MEKTKKIIILGTGGNCIDILDTINEINSGLNVPKYRCIGFLDDKESLHNKVFYGVKVLGSLENAKKYQDAYFINGIGSAKNYWKKQSIIDQTNIPVERFLTVIHPTASVSKMAILGEGSVIFQQATIASNARIGNHVMILPNSIISHDVSIGDYSCITAGVSISGRVRIGKSCYLGTNCSIIGDVVIGDYALIGMGSVVLKDVPKKCVVVGNPARLLKKITIEKV